MAELTRMQETLRGKTGVAFGNVPELAGFTLIQISGPSETRGERILESITSLDYALLGSDSFRLADIDYVLSELSTRLVDHGLVVVYHPGHGEEHDREGLHLMQRVISLGHVELVTEEKGERGHYYIFRFLKPMARTSAQPFWLKWAETARAWLIQLREGWRAALTARRSAK